MTNATISLEERTIKKVKMRIIPYIFLLYIIAFLDRVNLGYAALDMNQALGLTSEVFGLISGIFFFGYFIFEVPSNMILHRVGARVWIGRILISWGIVVIITAWAENATHLYILRFLLGVAEAGFFPGIILYITYWFRAKEQARAFALFMMALAASNIIGAPLSTWIMDHIDWFGMPGWRWMFILEGLPAVIFGFITFYYLTDRPDDAKWLTQEEKNWLKAELQREQEAKQKMKKHTTKEVFKNLRVWHLSLIYFTLVLGLYGIGFWMPQLIKAFSKSLSNTQVGLITMIPYIVGGMAMIVWARRSDRTGERRIHTAIPPAIGALGLIGAAISSDPVVSVIMMAIATAGIYSFFGPFWSLPALFLSEAAAAVGIAIINSFGNLGGFVGPYVLGVLEGLTGSATAGLFFLSLSLIATSLLVLAIRKEYGRSAN
ncbi:MFS transporter [Lihuaxuella thermophila]|uniref:MFS transporter, ACS family, tartrate transporter n=1 Tax=Lihuaxuella thermophila TaxID=1173111 RepID=A0A1H8EL03_9BACL|nr:MFS transporter [Lihuaxuella thermophila]SEN20175.1 MFS transporter, ACS family, tartrate transporter [Lihuaxuella thermophila]